MIKLVKKLIEWVFFRFVYEPEIVIIEEECGGEDLGFEIVFEPDLELMAASEKKYEWANFEVTEIGDFADAMSYSLGGAWDLIRFEPKFDNEVDQAMYEKKNSTVH